MKTKEPIVQSLRDNLLQLDKDARLIKIVEFLGDAISEYIGQFIDRRDLTLDYKVLIQKLNVSDEKCEETRHRLFDAIKQKLDLHFYYFEMDFKCIPSLAQLILEQIEVIFWPKKPSTILDMQSEPRNWPWTFAPNKIHVKIKEEVVFFLSCPRSGSTISRLILAGHPKIFSPPELHILPFESMGEREEQIKKNGFEWMRSGLIETFMNIHGWNPERSCKHYENLVENNVSIADVYLEIQEKIKPRYLVDKTPFYACHIEWLRRAEQIFEKPKYIFLTRHPYGMINSFVRLRLQQLTMDKFGPVDHNPWRLAEKWWCEGNTNISNFLTEIPSDRKLMIQYEDVCANAESTFFEVCQFLNIEYCDSILNPYKNSDIMINGVGDPNISTHNKIDASLSDSWRKSPPPQELSNDTLQLADQFGYPII